MSAVAHAGGCEHDKRTSSTHVMRKARSALRHIARLGSASDTGRLKNMDTIAHDDNPHAIASEWPRTIDRGAAAGENGLVNRMKAVGASDGKSKGNPLSHAATARRLSTASRRRLGAAQTRVGT